MFFVFEATGHNSETPDSDSSDFSIRAYRIAYEDRKGLPPLAPSYQRKQRWEQEPNDSYRLEQKKNLRTPPEDYRRVERTPPDDYRRVERTPPEDYRRVERTSTPPEHISRDMERTPPKGYQREKNAENGHGLMDEPRTSGQGRARSSFGSESMSSIPVGVEPEPPQEDMREIYQEMQHINDKMKASYMIK